jgi:Ca-activated chloride channel family protein
MVTGFSVNFENIFLRLSTLSIILIMPSLMTFAQTDKKYIRQGNREYSKEKYQESEVSYRRATDDTRHSPDAIFNIGDALYKQNKYEDAAKQFTENINMNEDAEKKAAGLYNLGNSFLQAKKLKESIDAYKGSLKLKPDNFEAKYNLAYAQDLLKQQEQQQQQQEQKDNKNQEKKDQDKQQDKQNKDQKNQDQKQDQKQQQQQPQEQTISKEDAQRLLNSLENDEKKVQEKVKLAKAAQERKLTVKNW